MADFHAGLVAAPVSSSYLSVRAHENFASIRNGVDCLTCHMKGTLSIGTSSINRDIVREALTLGSVESEKEISLMRSLYNVPEGHEHDEKRDPGTEVDTHLQEAQDRFSAAIRKMIGLDPMVPILPDASARYLEPLDFNQIALELFVSPTELAAAVQSSPALRKLFGLNSLVPSAGFSMERVIFEDRYCRLEEALRSHSRTSETAQK